MRFVAFILTLSAFLSAFGQTLNVKTGNVDFQFPVARTGEITYSDGKNVTIMNRSFSVDDIDMITIEETSIKDNIVNVSYNGETAKVSIAGNVAQYVSASVNGAHVSINQTNTSDVDGDEITYILSGNSSNGSLTMDGSYKCTIQLAGVELTA